MDRGHMDRCLLHLVDVLRVSPRTDANGIFYNVNGTIHAPKLAHSVPGWGMGRASADSHGPVYWPEKLDHPRVESSNCL